MNKDIISKIPLVGPLLILNEIVNKYLLAGDKFMLEMHLRQPGFTHSTFESFTKIKERLIN